VGHKNQEIFLSRELDGFKGSVLEIGSKDYGNTQDFRALLNVTDYVGLDLEEGPGVDIVHNLEESPLDRQFDLIICCSVLEHTQKPWIVAEHITQMLEKGGKLYISVPWVQRYHPYPDDYYRFSYSGIKALFPEIIFSSAKISTFKIDEFMDLLVHPMADSYGQCAKDNRPHLPCFEIHSYGRKE
jgi:SAM-dependent methyltransferase